MLFSLDHKSACILVQFPSSIVHAILFRLQIRMYPGAFPSSIVHAILFRLRIRMYLARFPCASTSTFGFGSNVYTHGSSSFSPCYEHSEIDILISFVYLFSSCSFGLQGHMLICASTSTYDFESLYTFQLCDKESVCPEFTRNQLDVTIFSTLLKRFWQIICDINHLERQFIADSFYHFFILLTVNSAG